MPSDLSRRVSCAVERIVLPKVKLLRVDELGDAIVGDGLAELGVLQQVQEEEAVRVPACTGVCVDSS